MKDRIEIDGKWYTLVPEEETKKPTPDLTLYSGCETPCGTFTFNVLLREEGEIWQDTGYIDWKKDKEGSYRFLPEIKRILGEHLIAEPPFGEDAGHRVREND